MSIFVNKSKQKHTRLMVPLSFPDFILPQLNFLSLAGVAMLIKSNPEEFGTK